MSPDEQTLIRMACTDLVARFHHHIDRFEDEKAAALFSGDGVWEHKTGDLRGPAEVLRYLAGKRRLLTMHVISNIAIDVIDASRATGRAYYTYYSGSSPAPAPAGPPDALGYYEDEFTLTADGWRFHRRKSSKLFGR